MLKKLTDKQKMFLINKGYVDREVVDGVREPEWYKYFIKFFDWELNTERNQWRMWDLFLIYNEYEDKSLNYHIELIFQGDDLNKLLSLKEE